MRGELVLRGAVPLQLQLADHHGEEQRALQPGPTAHRPYLLQRVQQLKEPPHEGAFRASSEPHLELPPHRHRLWSLRMSH